MRAVLIRLLATCLLAAISLPAQAKDFADLILHNGKVLTVDRDFSIVQAVALRGDRIIATGSDDAVLRLRGGATKVVDLAGRTVAPGLGDSHNHMSEVGLGLLHPSLEGSRSIADIVRVIQERVKETPSGGWIQTATIGEPAISALLKERRYPNRWDLDPVSPAHPVVISAPHVSIVNSHALKLTGVTRDTPDPPGGEIVRDPRTGEPTGVFLESAQRYVRRLLPEVTDDMRYRAILAAPADFNRLGITSVAQHGVSGDFLRAFQRAWLEGKLSVRVTLHPSINTAGELSEIQRDLDDLSRFASFKGFGDEYLKIAGIKIGLDGGVGIGTALQREPYVGAGGHTSHGIQRLPDDKFAAIVRLAAERNLRVAVHASGGGAMDKMFSAYETLQQDIDIRRMRFVAVHAQLPTEENYQQVKDLGMVVVAQPIFEYSMGSGYIKYLGRDLANDANPTRTWYERGIPVALGSDAPVNPHSPWLGIWHTQTRRDKETGEVLGPDQVVTREQAIIGYTRNVAYATFEEDLKGTLEPGKLADLVILDRDVLSVPVEEIKDIRVLVTIVGGKVVYEASGFSDLQ